MKPLIASLAIALLSSAASGAEYPAVLDWQQRITLSTPMSGVVAAVAVSAGDRVTADQVLLSLDERPFNTALQHAQAQEKKHRLQRDEAERELERTRELFERRVISVHDLQLEEITFASSAADYASALAALEAAQLAREYSVIRAPFAGLVLAIPVSEGETVINTEQAQPMVLLANDRSMIAQAALDASALADLAPGQPADVRIDGRHYAGRIAGIGSEPDTRGLYLLRVSFDPDGGRLRAGQPAHIETGS
ncbi:MAG: efflux RND transporter periplasmic adaptor subunit [Thiogranum sp.]|nr:efflux RND transporter periplasmic adaptor subunit [Thiogranum sp.]